MAAVGSWLASRVTYPNLCPERWREPPGEVTALFQTLMGRGPPRAHSGSVLIEDGQQMKRYSVSPALKVKKLIRTVLMTTSAFADFDIMTPTHRFFELWSWRE